MQDQIEIKHKKGVWARYIKLIFKCQLPVVWIVIYLVVDIIGINVSLDETTYTAELFAGDISAAVLTRLIIAIVLNIIISNLSVTVRQLTEANINRNARKAVNKKVLNLPMSFFADGNPRDAITRITVDIEAIANSLVLGFFPMVSSVYGIWAVLRLIGYYDYRLSLILAGFIPLFVLLTWVKGRISYSINNIDHSLLSILTMKLSELVENIPLTKAFVKEKQEAERGEEIVDRIYYISIKSNWYDVLFDSSQTVLDLLQTFLIIFVGLILMRNGELTLKYWVMFFLFSSQLNSYVSLICTNFTNIKTIQGGCQYIAEVMDAKEEENLGTLQQPLEGAIRFENISFAYGQNKPLYENASFTIPEKKMTAIVGENGCGKTTLVNLIQRLYQPVSGSIYVGTQLIQDYELHYYRSQISYMSQQVMLFTGSLRANLTYGLNKQVSDEEIWNALKQTKADKFVEALQGQLDYQVTSYGNNFSGGEKQKLALARVLLDNNQYLILDEATSNLDAISQKEVLDIIEQMDKTIIVIAHSEEIVKRCDHEILIENNQIKEVK